MSRWRVSVDGARCLASGLCVATAPEHFRLDGVTAEPVAELIEPHDAVLEAAGICPVEAISVRDDATGRLVAPAD